MFNHMLATVKQEQAGLNLSCLMFLFCSENSECASQTWCLCSNFDFENILLRKLLVTIESYSLFCCLH